MVAVFIFKIKRYICYALHLVRALHIESVFSLSYKKMWKFSRTKDERMTLTPCLFMARNTLVFSVFCSHIIRVWGLVSFIFVRVFPQPSCNKREQASHFLLYIPIPNCKKKEIAENP